MYQSIIVVDEFYDDPVAVRQRALACDYPEPEGPTRHPGRNSIQKLVPSGIDQLMCRVLGEPVVGPEDPRSSHGRFRITLAGEEGRFVAHVDPGQLQWAGIVYLTLPDQCRGGTAFFRHRGLESDRAPLTPEELRAHGLEGVGDILKHDGTDPDKWEHLMTVPMRFNRLVIYRPWLWHSAGESFGDSLETGRLIQVMQFRAGPARGTPAQTSR